jgi:hypothetical protein
MLHVLAKNLPYVYRSHGKQYADNRVFLT